MSKSQDIRAALAGGQIPFRKLHEKIGGEDKKLLDLCCYLRGKGEVKIGDDDDKTISLNGRRAPPRKGKKPAGKRGGKSVKKSARKSAKRPYQRLVDAHVGKGNAGGLRDLVLDNYLGAGALLRQAIEDGVEGIEQNLALRNAIANHDRAEKILAAARAA